MKHNAQQSARRRQTKEHVTYLRLTADDVKALRRIAEREERPVSYVMREAVREYIARNAA